MDQTRSFEVDAPNVEVTCPRCGGAAPSQHTRWGLRHACCDLWSWKGKPLVDAATHQARQAAHAAFDILWRERGWDRGIAYAWLADQLGIPEARAHMRDMDAATANRVVTIMRSARITWQEREARKEIDR